MQFILTARILFAFGAFFFALSATAGTAVSAIFQLLAALFLLLIRQHQKPLPWTDRGVWITAGIVAISNALVISGFSLLPLPTAAVLTQIAALWAILLAPLFGSKVSLRDGYSLILGIAGIVVIVGWEQGSLVGYGLIILSSLATALFTHRFAQAAKAGYDPFGYFIVVFLLGGIALTPWQPVWELTPIAWLACLGAAVCFGYGSPLNLKGMGEVAAHRSLLLKPLGSLLGILLGVVFLHDSVHWALLPGGVLILLAGHLAGSSHRQERERQSVDPLV